ncbi:MAG: phosphatase PAP2 family protein [Flavobacterium sp.]|nr:phosphatase PAP2 family protein [Pedobacter sp.]
MFVYLNINKAYSQSDLNIINEPILDTTTQLNVATDFNFFKATNRYRKATAYLPVLFTAYGFTAVANKQLQNINLEFKEEILEHHPFFKTKIDNYLQFSPSIIAFSMKAAGYKGQNNMFNSAKLYATSILLMAGTVKVLKSATRELRPDGSGRNSFPSGHTATAFAGAEFLHQEFKETSPLLCYSGYLGATATGVLRMYNNKHYLSDVVAGAGIGILTTKAAYLINAKLFNAKRKKVNKVVG